MFSAALVGAFLPALLFTGRVTRDIFGMTVLPTSMKAIQKSLAWMFPMCNPGSRQEVCGSNRFILKIERSPSQFLALKA
jgi:hypothetical protein